MAEPIENLPGFAFIREQGLIVPDAVDTLAKVTEEYKTALGNDIDTDPSTPQGKLIAGATNQRNAAIRAGCELANQINPNYAGGIFLDALCALLGLERSAASPSTIEGVTLTGVPGTIIQAGKRAKNSTNDTLWKLTSAVQLDNLGNGTGNFQSVDTGAIECGIGELDAIVDYVLGWETVTNPAEASLGVVTQSDASLRRQRKERLGLQGQSNMENVASAIRNLPGVLSVKPLENRANTTKLVEGISLAAHSVWFCVDGGSDDDIGLELLIKTCGPLFEGSQSVVVTDPWSGTDYTVNFERPVEIDLWLQITVKQITPVTNPITSVKEAVQAWIDGDVAAVDRPQIAGNISPFEIAAAISAQIPGLYVVAVEISDDGATWQTTEWDIDTDEVARFADAHIDVILV